MCYPAHIRIDESGSRTVQSVEEHCRQCAEYAAQAFTRMEKTAYLAGLLHDMGKYTAAFRDYIEQAAEGKDVHVGSVNHTFAGVRFAMERWHKSADPYRSLACELIAYAAGAHHGQFDCISPEGTNGFLHRLTTEGTGYEEARKNYLENCADTKELDRLFDEAAKEVLKVVEGCQPLGEGPEERLFYLALSARELLSAVIEGDRRDTAAFMRALPEADFREGTREWWAEKLSSVERRLSALPAEREIDFARRRISEVCRAAAECAGGVYRLTVPTGGGKTLAALRFSLAAAARGKKRVFFVVPLLSVLEQNAAVIRDYLADDRIILEHHSNVVRNQEKTEALDHNELLMENWDAPVVITTLVQFLDTLFAGKTSCIRRMAALSDSVIVLDEVQSVPRNLLSQFNLALNYLSGFCGATVVLCSATQPCLERTDHRLRYAEKPELVPYDAALWEVFRRTELIDRRRPEGYTVEELAGFSTSCAAESQSLLLICNTKAQAKALFSVIREQWDGLIFHLSTAMCMAHRIETLQKICAALEAHKRVICVSTQLVEAGVDFSFGCVIRVLAGMENAVQAAGRCNRSGELGRICPVYLVNLRGENLSHLQEIQQAQQAAEALLLRFRQVPEKFGRDLAGEAAIRSYYKHLFAQMKPGAQDYPLPHFGTTLFDLLSVNQSSRPHCATQAEYTLGQAFRTAGQEFCVFEDQTSDVLVPYGEGAELISKLCSARAEYDLAYRAEQLQSAGRFTVSLRGYELKRLQEAGGIYPVCGDCVWALRPEFYQADNGYSLEAGASAFLEV